MSTDFYMTILKEMLILITLKFRLGLLSSRMSFQSKEPQPEPSVYLFGTTVNRSKDRKYAVKSLSVSILSKVNTIK